MANIQKIKDVVDPVITVAELVDDAWDGVSLGEAIGYIGGVIGFLRKVKPAVSAVTSGEFLAVYASLSPAEKLELADWFEKEFDIKADSFEKILEQAFKAFLELGGLVDVLKEFKKKA